MKKVTKNKQNWFKLRFKKHPYLFTFLIGWIIIISVGGLVDYFNLPYYLEEPLLIIFVLLPPITFFLWFRKNKSKRKPFFKKIKKIFKPILYFLGSIASLIVIFVIVGIISTRGTSNFIERVKFEIIVLKIKSTTISNIMTVQRNCTIETRILTSGRI